MSVAAYDLGIHLQDVWPYLRSRGAVKIVGYQRSGKSTLAEVLQYELLQIHATVVHNDATKWLHGRTDRSEEPSPQAATVDPELAEAISGLEQEQDACWVVDDAEVLLAYATDNLLRNIGQKIMSGRFSMILIRNRFVHEHAGWFNDRESLLHADLPTLQLRPLPQPAALQAARASYHGPSADSQAAWLVTMSGGIPGLMSDLAPFAPAWANAERTGQLLAYAMRRRQELRLERPLRSALIRALKQRVLPPWAMLSPKAAVELRTLEISGMVNPRYAQRSEPFCGEFWHLQRLKGQHLGLYGGWGSRVSPVWARNPSMRAGRYWMRLSRFLTIAASWSTSRAARLPRPFFMFAQAPSAGLRSGA